MLSVGSDKSNRFVRDHKIKIFLVLLGKKILIKWY